MSRGRGKFLTWIDLAVEVDWPKRAKNFTIPLPVGEGVVGFGWTSLDWAGLSWISWDESDVPVRPRIGRSSGTKGGTSGANLFNWKFMFWNYARVSLSVSFSSREMI